MTRQVFAWPTDLRCGFTWRGPPQTLISQHLMMPVVAGCLSGNQAGQNPTAPRGGPVTALSWLP